MQKNIALRGVCWDEMHIKKGCIENLCKKIDGGSKMHFKGFLMNFSEF